MGLFDKKERKTQDIAAPSDRLAIFLANYQGVNPMYQADSAQAFEKHPGTMKVRKTAMDLQRNFLEKRERAGISPAQTWNPKALSLIFPFQWHSDVISNVSPKDLQPLLEKMDYFIRHKYLAEATEAEREQFLEKAGMNQGNAFFSNDRMSAYTVDALSTVFIFLLLPNVRPLQLSDGSYY